MTEKEIRYNYNEYWKKKQYTNIVNTQKFVPYLYALINIGCSYISTGELKILSIVLPLLYFSFVKMMIIILDKKLIKNFENCVGIFMFAFITFLKLVMNYYLHRPDNSLSYTFQMTESQYINFLSWLFINNYKTSFICAASNISIQIFFNYYWFDYIPDGLSLIDMGFSCLYYITLCYLIEQLNFKLFMSLSMKLTEAITELSRGMDNISEHLVIFNIDEGKNISLYHSSAEFNTKYINGDINVRNSKNPLEELFENFIYASRQDNESEMGKNANESVYCYNLLKDLKDFLDENKRNANVNYKKNIYVLRNQHTDHTKKEHFEVKFTIINAPILRHEGYDNKSILVLIKSINFEAYQTKNQQITDFGNIIISSLTHELKNPLNGLYGQLYLMDKENKSNNKFERLTTKVIDDPTTIAINDEQKHILEYKHNNDIIESELEKYKDDNVEGSAMVSKLLLCKYYNSNEFLTSYIKFSKYIKSKLNLIISNFEIYSKLKLKLLFNVNLCEISLRHLLNKCFKILYPIVELNNNKLILDTEMANFCLFKTDPHIFKILVKNIILLLEKQSKSSNLEIKVEINEFNKNKMFIGSPDKKSTSCYIQIHFIVTNYLVESKWTYGKSEQESKDVIDIYNKNNKKLSKLIDCKYTETHGDNPTLLKYTLGIPIHLVDVSNEGIESESNKSSGFIMPSEIDKCISLSDNKSECHNASFKNITINNRRKDSIYSMNRPIQPIQQVFKKSRFLSNTDVRERLGSAEITLINSHNEEDYTSIMQEHNNQIINHTKVKRIQSNEKNPKQHVSSQEDIDLEESILYTETRSSRCHCFRVLVVDDDYLCISYMSSVIKGSNDRYELSYNGQDAYDKVKKLIDAVCKICINKVIIIFMDIYMPILSGLDSAKMIDDYMKINSKGYKCKLYFISANINMQFIDIYTSLSIYGGFLSKPIKQSDILKVLKKDK